MGYTGLTRYPLAFSLSLYGYSNLLVVWELPNQGRTRTLATSKAFRIPCLPPGLGLYARWVRSVVSMLVNVEGTRNFDVDRMKCVSKRWSRDFNDGIKPFEATTTYYGISLWKVPGQGGVYIAHV